MRVHLGYPAAAAERELLSGIETVTEADLAYLEFGLRAGVDWVAISFVRSADDVVRVKSFIAERGQKVPVIAKIEKHEALGNIDAIVEAALVLLDRAGKVAMYHPGALPYDQLKAEIEKVVAR